jgi:hypothetical protein
MPSPLQGAKGRGRNRWLDDRTRADWQPRPRELPGRHLWDTWTREPMVPVWVAVVVLTTWLGGAPGLTWALDCGGRLVSEGQAPWEVQAICGEPTEVDDSVEIALKPAYDVFGRVVDHFPVAVPKSVWTYNFGSSRLVYRLTFREGKVVHIETGGYGH